MYNEKIGSNYNSRLSMKDIDKLVTHELKELYPNVKITCRNSNSGLINSKNVSLTLGKDCYFQSFDEWKDYIENNLNPSDSDHVFELCFLRITQVSELLGQNQDDFFKKYNNGNCSMLEEIYEEIIGDKHQWKGYALNDKGSEIYKTVKALYDCYNYDKSDAMTDYFNKNFCIDYDLKDDLTLEIEYDKSEDMEGYEEEYDI